MKEHPAWRSPLHSIRDRISFATSAAPLRVPAYRALDALQFSDPAVQLDALFLLAVAMSTVVGIDPHEMVTRAKRVLPEAEGPFTEQLQAAREYAKGELK